VERVRERNEQASRRAAYAESYRDFFNNLLGELISNAALGAGTLWLREITRFTRQRSRVIGSFLQPLVFWLLLGAGLTASFRPAGMPTGMNYFEYLYPGFIVLVLLFGGGRIW